MNFIIWLVVGGVTGWLASILVKTSPQEGAVLNVVVAPSAEVDPARSKVTRRNGTNMNKDNRKLDATRDRLIVATGLQPAGTGVRAVVGGRAGNGLAEALPVRNFDPVESRMSRNWAGIRAATNLSWGRARHTARDAWNRISPSS